MHAADFAWMAAHSEIIPSGANQFRKCPSTPIVNRMMIAPIVAFQRCSDVYVTEDVTRIAEAPPEKRLRP